MDRNNEKNLLDLLDIVILMQMLVEKVENFQLKNHYNKQLIKQQLKAVLKTITPLAERDYNIVFSNGETETQQIISFSNNIFNLAFSALNSAIISINVSIMFL